MPAELGSLLGPLRALSDLLRASGTRGVVIGGVAVSLLGRPRFTADVDALLLLPDGNLEDFLEQAGKHGLAPRIPDAAAFARRNRVLLLRHPESRMGVDLSLGMLPFEEELLDRSTEIRVGGIRIRIPSPEDLVVLKAVAHRSQDMLDIASLLEARPGMDLRRVRRWVNEFARALEMPEIRKDLEGLLRKPKGPRKPGTKAP